MKVVRGPQRLVKEVLLGWRKSSEKLSKLQALIWERRECPALSKVLE